MKKIAIVLTVLLLARSSWAVGGVGYSNQVMGTRALGMGNAFAGIADDPTAVYYNPAGLTQLENPALTFGVFTEPIPVKYDSGTGVTDKTKNVTALVPHFYTAVPFCDKKWTFGFGVNAPYGLETHWSETGPLRYAATDSKAANVDFNPELAYKVNDKISVAGGIVYGITSASLEAKINQQALGSTTDGNKKLTGDGDGWGYNLGVLFKPIEKHSLGISYRSKITSKIKGKSEMTDIAPALQGLMGGSSYTTDTKTELSQPESVLIGYGYRPGKWTFALDAEWIAFGQIKETNLSYAETNQARLDNVLNVGNPIPRDWHNTWNYGLGANYKFNETWEARGGYFYQNNVIPESTWNPSIPDSNKSAYNLGASFNRPSFSVEFSYSYVVFQERTVHSTQYVGSVDNVGAGGTYNTKSSICSLSYTQRFGVNK